MQMKEVLDYLISGEEGDKIQFEEFGREARRALDEWEKFVGVQMQIGLDVQRNMESKYNEALAIVSKAFELASAGRTGEAFELMEERVELLIDDALFPEITKAVEDSKREVIEVHQNLLDLTLTAEEQGIGALAIVSLLIFFVSFGLIRGMIASLDKLRKGTEIVASGGLDHRIDLTSQDEFGQLASSFNKMTEAMQKSREGIINAQQYTDRILRSMNESLIVFSLDGHIQTVNDVTCKMLGYEEKELLYQPIEKIFGVELQSGEPGADDLFKKSFIGSIERNYQTKDGRKIPVLFSSSVMRDGGRVQGIVCLARDITERRQVEEARKKELLLKEIHHRVKNNLQVISTLLDLQSKYVKDERVAVMFKESQNRIRSMAFIHEKLYLSKDLGMIDFAEYVQDLAVNLFRSYGVNSDTIRLKINAFDAFLSIDTAIPCGLIITELVSNSLKYAFPSGRTGEVYVNLSSYNDGEFVLIVGDSGAGFPKDLDFENTKSLGLKLVATLVKQQLKGTIDMHTNGRTEFRIVFKER
jgi:PAS domain S-box-containing protein